MSEQKIVCPKCKKSGQIRKIEDMYICLDCSIVAAREQPKPEGEKKPLKLFLSYPHAQAGDIPEGGTYICDLICEALKKRGHDVWFDREQLTGHHGADWRKSIYDGIASSSTVLSCLNRHAVRKDENGRHGVCLDELKIAVSVKGGNIKTILLEPENLVKPNAMLAHRQWLDLSDWDEKMRQGKEVFDPWFKERMDDIFRMIESEDNYEFEGDIKAIKEKLTMHDFRSSMHDLLEKKFVGRQWLVREVDEWLNRENDYRVCVIFGDPGVGKSAFACQYAFSSPNVGAVLRFEYGNSNYNTSKAIIQSIAYQLACRLPDYRRHLLYSVSNLEMDRLKYTELFQELLVKPLKESHIDGGHETLCIVIDALDECGKTESADVIRLINDCAGKFPVWLKVLVTSRKEADIVSRLAEHREIEIHSDSSLNLDDIREYCLERLEGKDEEKTAETAERITERSEGSFLYAYLATEGILNGTFDIHEEHTLPNGLNGMMHEWFKRLCPGKEQFEKNVRIPLQIMVSSPYPFPTEEFRYLLRKSDHDVKHFMKHLQVFLKTETSEYGKQTVSFSHKRIQEWITSGIDDDFNLSETDGLNDLAKRLYRRLEEDADALTVYETMCLPEILERAGLRKEYKKAMNSSSLAQKKYLLGIYEENRCHYDSAKDCYECAEEIIVNCEGKESENRVKLLLAQAALSAVRYDRAGIEKAEKAFEINRKRKGEEHRDTLDALTVYAFGLFLCGELKHAEEYFEYLYETRKKNQGEEDLNTAAALYYLALIDHGTGNFDSAMKKGEEALRIRRKNLGETDQLTLTSLSFLASNYKSLHDYETAAKLAKEVYETSERKFGEDNPFTVNALTNYASAFILLGKDPDLAAELSEKAYEAQKRVSGEESRKTIIALSNLASAYRRTGNLEKTADAYEKLYEVRKKVLGGTANETISAASYLISAQRALHDDVRVLEVEEELYRAYRKDRTLQTFVILLDLLQNAFKAGNMETVKEYGEDITDLSEVILKCPHPDIINQFEDLLDEVRKTDMDELKAGFLALRYQLARTVRGGSDPVTMKALADVINIYKDLPAQYSTYLHYVLDFLEIMSIDYEDTLKEPFSRLVQLAREQLAQNHTKKTEEYIKETERLVTLYKNEHQRS